VRFVGSFLFSKYEVDHKNGEFIVYVKRVSN